MTTSSTDTCAWKSRIVGHAQLPPDELLANPMNFRRHPTAQQNAMKGALDEVGWIQDVIVNRTTGHIIDGHLRVELARRHGAEHVPVKYVELTEEEERVALATFDPIGNLATVDVDLQMAVISDLQLTSPDLTEFLRSSPDTASPGRGGRRTTDADETPDADSIPVSRAGDVWLCGAHRVMCGSSVSEVDVKLLLRGDAIALMHADPPYGMGKEADGVMNDNLYGDKLDAFQLAWWKTWRPWLASNGSAYIWGNAFDLWRLWFRADGLGALEPLTLRNEIVWDKKSIAGMASPEMTQFPTATERCLFFQLGRHVLQVNRTKEDYWPGWEPIRLKLCAERDRAGFTASQIKKICGNHMYGHWFTKSQWAIISRDNYEKLQAAADGKAFTQPYDELLAEYRAIEQVFKGEVMAPARAEFVAARPFFDNAHDIMRDVWEFPRVSGEERFGHATPKPVAMMERCIKSTTRPGELVAEPFGGTGATLMACETTGRGCRIMELQPQFTDVIVRRWQDFTGQEAVLERTGEAFTELEDERL